MAKSRKGLVAAAAAFAASPQGRKLIQQAKDYASRPENKAKAQQLLGQVKERRAGGKPSYGTGTNPGTNPGTNTGTTPPPYGTPPR